MQRIKITDNFFLDEFVHPNIYNRFKGNSRLYVNPSLIELVQLIREKYGEPININTWARGGSRINSGVRDYFKPLGKLNRSRHYYGLCADLTTADIKKLQKHVDDNKDYYYEFGLRVIEDFRYTRSWCHISVENTGLNKVKFIKP
jgi:hypothetical protein